MISLQTLRSLILITVAAGGAHLHYGNNGQGWLGIDGKWVCGDYFADYSHVFNASHTVCKEMGFEVGHHDLRSPPNQNFRHAGGKGIHCDGDYNHVSSCRIVDRDCDSRNLVYITCSYYERCLGWKATNQMFVRNCRQRLYNHSVGHCSCENGRRVYKYYNSTPHQDCAATCAAGSRTRRSIPDYVPDDDDNNHDDASTEEQDVADPVQNQDMNIHASTTEDQDVADPVQNQDMNIHASTTEDQDVADPAQNQDMNIADNAQ